MKQISVFGCGAMGTNIANLLAENVTRLDDYKNKILWFVRDEECFGERLIDVINGNRENPKYAPNVRLKDNIEAKGDPVAVASASDVIFFVYATRHVNEILREISGHLKPNVLFISLSKGLLVTEPTETVPDQVIRLVSEEILRVTKSPCVVVSGGVNAKGLANGDFAEATIGCPNPERAQEAKLLLQNQNLFLTCTPDVTTVEICGALKNILVLAAGIVDGLRLGTNTKSAVIRLGLYEIGQFCQYMYAKYDTSYTTLLQSCGISELFLCLLHRSDVMPQVGDDFDFFNLIIGRMLAEPKYAKLSLEEIERSLHPDCVASGPDCARKVYARLESMHLTEQYPLFTAVHLICARQIPADSLLKMLQNHPAHQ
ncbi:hypothetical protein AAHC03_016688 [Spirometra sp. Aus1]|nr:unnamed protein product [Spirometra erinaceieuropaei]